MSSPSSSSRAVTLTFGPPTWSATLDYSCSGPRTVGMAHLQTFGALWERETGHSRHRVRVTSKTNELKAIRLSAQRRELGSRGPTCWGPHRSKVCSPAISVGISRYVTFLPFYLFIFYLLPFTFYLYLLSFTFYLFTFFSFLPLTFFYLFAFLPFYLLPFDLFTFFYLFTFFPFYLSPFTFYLLPFNFYILPF